MTDRLRKLWGVNTPDRPSNAPDGDPRSFARNQQNGGMKETGRPVGKLLSAHPYPQR